MANNSTTWKERCIWIAVIALIIIVAILTFWLGGKGSEIVSYVSFAAACVSIFLAITAIFYSFLEHGYSRQHIGQMDALIRDASIIMRDASHSVSENVGLVVKSAESIKESQEFLAKTVSDFDKGPPLTSKADQSKEPQFRLNIAGCKWTQLFALYCMSKLSESKHTLDMNTFIDAIKPHPEITRGSNVYDAFLWQNAGIFMGISCFLETGSISVNPSRLKVTKFPKDAVDYISESIQQEIDQPSMEVNQLERFKAIKANIDHITTNPLATKKSTQ